MITPAVVFCERHRARRRRGGLPGEEFRKAIGELLANEIHRGRKGGRP